LSNLMDEHRQRSEVGHRPAAGHGGAGGGGRCSLDEVAAAIWPSTHMFLSDDILGEIADQAAAADERGDLATATLDRLRQAAYFGLPVPSALDGGGAGLLECAAVQRRIGMADPALAIAVNMHLFSVGMAAEHWLRHRDACGLLLAAIAAENRIVASAFAEPGLGGSLLRSTATARRTAGGYLVTGTKSPCSLAEHCDLVCFQMQADPVEPAGLMTALIPVKTPGVRIKRTWDTLGMRASGSETLLLDNCFVPDELVFHRCEPGVDDDEVFAAGIVWFCITTTATYLGVVQAAIAAACGELRRSTVAHLDSTRAALPSVQGQLGELVATTLALEAGCAGVAGQLDSRQHDPRSLVPLAVAIKHVAVDICVRAVEESAELVGGRSYARTGLFARLWRDVQAMRFHPPTRLASRQILGKWALDLPFSFELDERPSGARSPHDGAARSTADQHR
jgi:alkylation response protein AidB-like acyl-CoA dehydrogenase